MKRTRNVRYALDCVRAAGVWVWALALAGSGLTASVSLLVPGVAVAQPTPDEDPSGEDADASPPPDASPRPAPVATSTAVVAPPPRPVALPAPVQIRSDVTAPPVPHRSGLGEIVERLETRAEFLRKGNTTSADVELGQLFELRETLGNVNVPLASSLLVHESRQALGRGDAKAALAAAEAAVRLSPDMVAAHWQRFDAAAATDGGTGLAIAAARDALVARVSGFRNQVAALTDLLGILVLTIVGVTLLFTLLQLARYVRCAAADVAERLPGWAGMFVSSLVVLLVLFAPLAAGLGVAPTLALWLAGAMLYQTARERVASLALLVALGAVPLVMYAASPLLVLHGSSVDALASLATEAFAPDAEARLLAEADKSGRRDYELCFLLGRRSRAIGDLEGAERWYTAALAAKPGDVAAQNNLGVVLYLQRKPDAALSAWKSAGRTRAEPVLNASAVDLEASRFDEAKAGLEAARRIDDARARQFSDSTGDIAQRLLDVPFDQGLLWTRLSRDLKSEDAIVQGLWSRIGGPVPWMAFPVLALALGLLAWALGARVHAPFSTPCPKCGQPASRRAVDGYCAQCQTIFLKAVAVEPAMRLAKESAIRRYQGRTQWSERLASVLAGSGHVLGGRPLEGLVLLVLFVGLAVHWLWMDRLSVHPWATGLGLGAWHLGITAALCGVLALVAIRRTWEK